MREKHKYLKLKMMHGKYLNCYSGSEKTQNKTASFEAAKTQQILLSVFRHLKYILSGGTSAF